MKKLNKKGYIEIGIILLIILLAYILGLTSSNFLRVIKNYLADDYTPKHIPNSEEEILNNCEGLGLENTSLCFRDNIKTFFRYDETEPIYILNSIGEDSLENTYDGVLTITPTNIKIIDYLKENGGICREWSLFYLKLCKKTNFKCEQVRRSGVLNVFPSHIYTIMYDDKNYCELDQLTIKCGENHE